jgi:hypothetical protein
LRGGEEDRPRRPTGLRLLRRPSPWALLPWLRAAPRPCCGVDQGAGRFPPALPLPLSLLLLLLLLLLPLLMLRLGEARPLLLPRPGGPLPLLLLLLRRSLLPSRLAGTLPLLLRSFLLRSLLLLLLLLWSGAAPLRGACWLRL